MKASIKPETVKELAAEFFPQTLRIRRHMHRHPELSFEESETSAFLCAELDALGLPYTAGVGGQNGIVARVAGRSGTNGRVSALRADFDALPIQEETGLDFASERPGVMHACGHDGHSSMLLTAAMILKRLSPDFDGRVMLVFQPAEEKVPGGAVGMIKAGSFLDPRPGSIIGQHIHPGLASGSIGFRDGLMMASVDDFAITVIGKGGHGASPQLCVDPVVVSAQIITAVQQIVSRNADPQTPTVLTFGRISGNGATNIIPGEVYLEGTFRTVDETWREQALGRIHDLVQGLAKSLGAEARVEIKRGYPAVYNDAGLTKRLRAAAEVLVGPEKVVDLPLVMWAEDFAYYGKVAPSCFFNLGVADFAKGWTGALHSSRLMIDENALKEGSAALAWFALAELDAI